MRKTIFRDKRKECPEHFDVSCCISTSIKPLSIHTSTYSHKLNSARLTRALGGLCADFCLAINNRRIRRSALAGFGTSSGYKEKREHRPSEWNTGGGANRPWPHATSRAATPRRSFHIATLRQFSVAPSLSPSLFSAHAIYSIWRSLIYWPICQEMIGELSIETLIDR